MKRTAFVSFVALIALAGVTASATGRDVRTAMQIIVTANDKTLVYALNDSQAAKELFAQLPMRIEVEDYGGKEKIFYPPKKLNTADTPLAENIKAGTLAYYAPWGDVVMFYKSFGPAAGLYALGHLTSGGEHIPNLSGTLRIEKAPE